MCFTYAQRSFLLVDFLRTGMVLATEDETGAGSQEVIDHVIQVHAHGEWQAAYKYQNLC